MAHYAFLDEKNIVTEVITGIDETELIDGILPEEWYANFRNQKCVRTSYNNKIRFNYAGIGYIYDPVDDAFVAPMPGCGHDSLTLNDLKRWECADCDEIAKRLASIEDPE
jgi:hypothetical protein